MSTAHKFGALFIAVALSGGCSNRHSVQMSSTKTSNDGASVRVASHSKFANTTEKRDVVADVPDGMKSHVLDLSSLEVEQGSILVKLFAPDGTVKVERELHAEGQLESEYPLEPSAGQWRLEIDMRKATGSYDINWRVDR